MTLGGYRQEKKEAEKKAELEKAALKAEMARKNLSNEIYREKDKLIDTNEKIDLIQLILSQSQQALENYRFIFDTTIEMKIAFDQRHSSYTGLKSLVLGQLNNHQQFIDEVINNSNQSKVGQLNIYTELKHHIEEYKNIINIYDQRYSVAQIELQNLDSRIMQVTQQTINRYKAQLHNTKNKAQSIKNKIADLEKQL